ncbi:hypothetical protein QTI51_37975 [Variovorax sp. J22G73]|uniref:hypothetical protein n=1 Tax=unclassified Variovorax TaxID=663243 RepID=UPI002578B4C3|nr:MULTISPECIES: hypothetical protein [unclassified Variovorax]MDM0010559.1 hypothetical protein [Variovorax sp. J22R203]MDM0103112.1 hypothetical protein [Variovorax sp. J22G73]
MAENEVARSEQLDLADQYLAKVKTSISALSQTEYLPKEVLAALQDLTSASDCLSTVLRQFYPQLSK